MTTDLLMQKAEKHLHKLCEEITCRETGSQGNRSATDYFAGVMAENGFEVEHQPFPCIDMRTGDITLTAGRNSYNAHISPYSLGCDVHAKLVHATTIDDLEKLNITGKLLLLSGEITAEQLMPKNFIFYNPEHHQKIYRLLEEKHPAAIITATTRNPEMTGGLYPFPMFEDGDFDIPTAYMTDVEGRKLTHLIDQEVHLKMEAVRIPSTAENISAQKGEMDGRIVICAHIDAKASTPGALDNAGGSTILMLLADLMNDYRDEQGVEILAINGEDNFSAGGEMEYIRRHQTNFNDIRLVINLDGVGYKTEPTGISYYECPQAIKEKAAKLVNLHADIEEMPQWYQGDHMVFVSQGVPAVALTTTAFAEIWPYLAHTNKDIPQVVDCGKLVETAEFLLELIKQI